MSTAYFGKCSCCGNSATIITASQLCGPCYKDAIRSVLPLRFKSPTILCSQCGEPLIRCDTPAQHSDPRYQCLPCGRTLP
jgi:predicted RNA-binding Zn-ribbon protein involved in translation (DUF1610 family)